MRRALIRAVAAAEVAVALATAAAVLGLAVLACTAAPPTIPGPPNSWGAAPPALKGIV